MECWSIRVLECWSAGALEYWGRNRHPFGLRNSDFGWWPSARSSDLGFRTSDFPLPLRTTHVIHGTHGTHGTSLGLRISLRSSVPIRVHPWFPPSSFPSFASVYLRFQFPFRVFRVFRGPSVFVWLLQFAISDFGFRPSFGFRISGFGFLFAPPLTSPLLF